MRRIEFTQSKPRVEDWRVKPDSRTVGNVWKAGAVYMVSVSTKATVPT